MDVFYNEHDGFAAGWLSELAIGGHIPGGRVDARSICDLRADDLRSFRQCHFFAGIGGWAYALSLAGWPEGREVWTGSCPCQPLSSAGLGRGHADERHLWPAFYRLIAERRPATIFGEQVASKDGREWLAGVRADLETLGYAIGAADLPAASVGAPHIRQRLFWVANAECRDERGERRRLLQRPGEDLETLGSGASGQPFRASPNGGLADAAGVRCEQQWRATGLKAEDRPSSESGEIRELVGNTEGSCGTGGLADAGYNDGAARSARSIDQPGASIGQRIGSDSAESGLAHPSNTIGRPINDHRQDGCDGTHGGWPEAHGEPGTRGEVRGLGFADGQRRDGQPIRLQSGQSREACLETPWASAAWLLCLDGKARRVEPGIFPLANGIPNRVGRLRGYGNAIVPQVAAEFVRAFLETE